MPTKKPAPKSDKSRLLVNASKIGVSTKGAKVKKFAATVGGDVSSGLGLNR